MQPDSVLVCRVEVQTDTVFAPESEALLHSTSETHARTVVGGGSGIGGGGGATEAGATLSCTTELRVQLLTALLNHLPHCVTRRIAACHNIEAVS